MEMGTIPLDWDIQVGGDRREAESRAADGGVQEEVGRRVLKAWGICLPRTLAALRRRADFPVLFVGAVVGEFRDLWPHRADLPPLLTLSPQGLR